MAYTGRNILPDLPTPGNAGVYIATPPADPKLTDTSKKTSTKKKTTKKTPTKKVSSKSSKSSSSSSSSSSAAKKSADGAQVDALKRLLDGGFRSQMDERISNIDKAQREGDALLMSGYNTRLSSLQDLRKDNEMAEGQSSFANLTNRVREAGDVLAQAATQGAGETDQLQAQLIAARNWAANQAEVNRAYHDSRSSNNASIIDLNADTRSARFNLAQQGIGDREQAWATYSNQMTETATQLANILANPYSDRYSADGAKDQLKRMTDTASTVWKSPGVNDDIENWQGVTPARQELLNNSRIMGTTQDTAAKRPEGSTLRDPATDALIKGNPVDPDAGLWDPTKQDGSTNSSKIPRW